MHLLQLSSDGSISRITFHGPVPPYAILSHRWFDEEPTYQDITNGTGKSKHGYAKLRFCAKEVDRDGLKYFWVDTVCIDKTSSAELTEALNSMFRWYQEAAKCYVLLTDCNDEHDFARSAWFTRGWTLPELIAPRIVCFFSDQRMFLGTKASLERQIHARTGIPIAVLQGRSLADVSVAERMSWVKDRETTREEDKAYCLLGIFDVFMPVIYGERSRAFTRLREEIEKLPKETDNTSVAKKDKHPSTSETKPIVYNNGFNCFKAVPASLSGWSQSIKYRCQTCGFKWKPDADPGPLAMGKGRSVPYDSLLQKFHYRPEGKWTNMPALFRCFICRHSHNHKMNWEELREHLMEHHTYDQICKPGV
ncbi:MAG: hypothetical protein Q9220_007828 [cf. Caloplaca sp. 1 TL-2023]